MAAENSLQNETNKENNEEPITRKEKRKEKRLRRKRLRVRKFPIPLRIIVVLLLLGLSLMLGAMVGYGVIGDGTPTDVLHKETWQHIFDIVKKKK